MNGAHGKLLWLEAMQELILLSHVTLAELSTISKMSPDDCGLRN